VCECLRSHIYDKFYKRKNKIDYREAADKVVKGEGKFEELIVCSNEIAASTAQLVVASKVKADRRSKKLSSLSEASKGVTQATGKVVGCAREGSQIIDEKSMYIIML